MKCEECENIIGHEQEYIKVDWYGTGEYMYFCDIECLIDFVRDVIEFGGGE